MANKKEETPREVTVEERLKALYKLQTVASQIDRIRTIRGELPIEVQELEDELEGRHTRYAKFEEELKRLDAKNKQNEEDIRISKQSIEKYTEQLNTVRNNREYDLLTKEVEFQNLQVEGYEKNIANNKERAELIREDMKVLAEETEGRQKDLEHKQEELDQIISETKQDEERLRLEARELEEVIDDRLLAAFHRTRKSSRNGLAVVSIDRDACMGCFNKIPPQRMLDVQAHKKIIVCEYCGRVLVDPDLAEEVRQEIKETEA